MAKESRAKAALGGKSHKSSKSKKSGHVHRMTIERSHGNKHYIVRHQSDDAMNAPSPDEMAGHVVSSPDEMSAHLDQHMPLEAPEGAAGGAEPGPGQAPPQAGGAMQGM